MKLGKLSSCARARHRPTPQPETEISVPGHDEAPSATRWLRILLVYHYPEPELTRTLARHGHDVLAVDDDGAATRLLDVFSPELILVVGDHPAACCRALRSVAPHISLVAIAATDSVEERVAALEAGADDRLGRPFRRAELIARINAAHRRAGHA